MANISGFQVQGDPPPWSVVDVNNFIVGALARVEDGGGALPRRFRMSCCPWGERNAVGGTPLPVQEVTDPRLRLVHFTGCGRPYLVALFIGDDAARRQDAARGHLPWSEHFDVSLDGDVAALQYLDYTEDLWGDEEPDTRSLRELLQQGELEKF
jgi:hypothetical protein